jgi:peptidoglycan/LPS O-acetylase OafA/YrhL
LNHRYFPELESIRGLAALMVLFEHYVSFGRVGGPVFASLLVMITHLATLAVLTFFVLSGFVLTHALVEDSPRHNVARLVMRFWIRRVFRIWPLAIIVILAAFLFFGGVDRYVISLSRWAKYSDFSWNTLIGNLLFMNSSLNTPGWTLKYEIAGYALLPFTFLSVVLKGAGRYIALCILVAGYFLVPYTWPSWPLLSAGFVTGFSAYYGYRMIRVKGLSRAGTLILACAGVAPVSVWAAMPENQFLYPLASIGISCLLVLILLLPRQTEFLRSRWARRLGQISFSIYLVHYPIMWAFAAAVTGGHVTTDNLWTWLFIGCVTIPTTFLVAFSTYRFIEAPARAFGARVSNKVGSLSPMATTHPG